MKTMLFLLILSLLLGCAASGRNETIIVSPNVDNTPISLDKIYGKYSNGGIGSNKMLWYVLTDDDDSKGGDDVDISHGMTPDHVTIKLVRDGIEIKNKQSQLQVLNYSLYQDKTHFLYLFLVITSDIGRKRIYKLNGGNLFVTINGEKKLAIGYGVTVKHYSESVEYYLIQ